MSERWGARPSGAGRGPQRQLQRSPGEGRKRALSIVKSVGRLPLDKIIIHAVGGRLRKKSGRGCRRAGREGVNRELVRSLRGLKDDRGACSATRWLRSLQTLFSTNRKTPEFPVLMSFRAGKVSTRRQATPCGAPFAPLGEERWLNLGNYGRVELGCACAIFGGMFGSAGGLLLALLQDVLFREWSTERKKPKQPS